MTQLGLMVVASLIAIGALVAPPAAAESVAAATLVAQESEMSPSLPEGLEQADVEPVVVDLEQSEGPFDEAAYLAELDAAELEELENPTSDEMIVETPEETSTTPQMRGPFDPGLPPYFQEEPKEQIAHHDWRATPTIVNKNVVHNPMVGLIVGTALRYDATAQSIEIKTDYSCTGTVVTSATKSVIITAGHCIWPRNWFEVRDLRFIPAYHRNAEGHTVAPFGSWGLTKAVGMNCWIAPEPGKDRNDYCDQAFAKVAPRASDGKKLQEVVGSTGLTIGGPAERGAVGNNHPELTVQGYPKHGNAYPTIFPDEDIVHTCRGTTYAADQLDVYWKAIQMPCSALVTGGFSGAGLIEQGQSGVSVIATLKGKESWDSDPLFRLNDIQTKSLYMSINT